jgi:hypothetical protein
MQSSRADGFSVGDALLAQPVAVVVSVPAQLDVSHASILLGGRCRSVGAAAQRQWPDAVPAPVFPRATSSTHTLTRFDDIWDRTPAGLRT